MTSRHVGVTLPETLLAVITSSVLAALAVAVWQSQTVARHVTSAADDVQPIMDAVAQAYTASAEPPRQRADAGLDPDPAAHRSRYLESVDVRDGVVSLYFGHRANPSIAGRTLRLESSLDINGERVHWHCGDTVPDAGSAAVPRRHWPDICSSAGER